VPNRAASPIRPTHREVTWRYLAEVHAQAGAVVRRHYRRRLTLDDVARTLATSPRQLQRAYADIGHTTFSAQLRAIRLRNAAELLAHQPLTVTDVARLVGYRQPSHFVKAFRRRYGLTPGAFRDTARHRTPTERTARGPRDAATRRAASARRDRSGRLCAAAQSATATPVRFAAIRTRTPARSWRRRRRGRARCGP
jgi:AraC family transcriptional regulator of adaptative response / methylphosphotriester-DNA alkyltransferase methyltransferase